MNKKLGCGGVHASDEGGPSRPPWTVRDSPLVVIFTRQWSVMLTNLLVLRQMRWACFTGRKNIWLSI